MSFLLKTILITSLQLPVAGDVTPIIPPRIVIPETYMVYAVDGVEMILSNERLWCDEPMSAFILMQYDKSNERVVNYGCWNTMSDKSIIGVFILGHRPFNLPASNFIPMFRVFKYI